MKSTFNVMTQTISKLKGKWLALLFSGLIITGLFALIAGIFNVGAVVAYSVLGFVFVGEITFTRKLINNQNYKLEDLFEDYRLFLSAFLVTITFTVALLLGFALLIVPGVIVLLYYSFSLHTLENDKSIGALEALKQSKKLSDKNLKKILFFYLYFLVILIAVYLVSLLIALIPHFIWGFNTLILALLISSVINTTAIVPLFFASLTNFYDALKSGELDKKEDLEDELDEVLKEEIEQQKTELEPDEIN